MGKRGPIPRPNEQLNGRSKSSLVLLEGQKFDPGEPPFPNQMNDWELYWSSPAGNAARPEDKPVVERLFKLRANFEAALSIASEEPQVAGSTGQLRPNPFFDTALKLEAAIIRLENELGLTPKARAALGLTVAQAGLTVQQINERLPAPPDPVAVEAWTIGGTDDEKGLAEEA